MTEVRREWVCSGCKVRVYAPGKSIPAPKGWRFSDDACLKCQRSGKPEDAAREALLDGRSVGDATAIAGGQLKRPAVKKLRAGLIREGLVPEDEPEDRITAKSKRVERKEPKPSRPRVSSAVEHALRTDPNRTNSEIARELNCAINTVGRVRRKGDFSPSPRAL